jgi:hypothetical protein
LEIIVSGIPLGVPPARNTPAAAAGGRGVVLALVRGELGGPSDTPLRVLVLLLEIMVVLVVEFVR